MKVLLLHPDDPIPALDKGWDLVVDLGRAPAATYDKWSQQARARVVSLYDFARDREDLQRVRELLQLGMGRWVDASGIDWWDVLSLLIEPDLRQLILIGRLARELKGGCELYASRSGAAATALQALTGAQPVRRRGWIPSHQTMGATLSRGLCSAGQGADQPGGSRQIRP